MRSDPNRHPKLDSRLKSVVFLLAGALALLTIGLGTAFAEGEEEGPAPVDPVVVPEVEVPTVSNPPTAPSEAPAAPAPSSPAPVTGSSGSSGSSGGHTSSPSTGSRGSSGGSKPTTTQTNNGLTGSGGSGSSGGNGGGSTGSGGGGGNSTSVPTGSSSPTSTAGLERSTSDVEKAAAALATHAGQSTGKGKKAQQDAVSHLGEAVGKALLGAQVSVSKPKPHHDVVPAFVPLPGKNKALYFLLILVILAVASFVVWTQFRGPRQSRRRKAHIDHRTATAARLTPAERLRARQWTTEDGRKDARPPGRKARPARRKAA
jgi:hypothetical protein